MALNTRYCLQKAGITANVNLTVSHYNAFTKDVENILKYSHENGYTSLINVACPVGAWEHNQEIMVDDADVQHLIELRKKYKNINRNLWNPFDRNYENVLGCNTVNRIYITPKGDVLACPFVHIKIGNIYENSLKEIIDFGFTIKYFRNYSKSCLSCEDKEFQSKYMQPHNMSIFNPKHASEVFKENDFITN